MMPGTGVCEQAGRTVPLIAPQPLADRGHGGGEEPCGGFNAPPFGALDETQAMVGQSGF